MDELMVILNGRQQSMKLFKEEDKQRHKSWFVDEERKRVQRQNWILKLLKSLRIFSVEQKKAIYDLTIKLMNSHTQMPDPGIDFEHNYTESFINLFVQFYNRIGQTEVTMLKSIVRPNNYFIIVDLLKALVEFSRSQFRAVINAPCQEKHSEIIRRKNFSLRIVKSKQAKRQSTQVRNEEEAKQDFPQQIKIDIALSQKYLKNIEQFNEQSVQSKINDIYQDLLASNNKNSMTISRFYEACFGPRRHINYDVAGLYTQEEMKKIALEKLERSKFQLTCMRDLTGACTAEQLKENFKMKVELHESDGLIPSLKEVHRSIQWFPWVVTLRNDKDMPLALQFIDENRQAYSIHQFEEKVGKTTKNYARQCLMLHKGQYFALKKQKQAQFAQFSRKQYLDYQQVKVLEVINKEGRWRDVIFPSLRQYQQRDEEQFRSKTRSTAALPLQLISVRQRMDKCNFERELEKGISYSKFIRQINNKERVNELVQSILLRSREYSVKLAGM